MRTKCIELTAVSLQCDKIAIRFQSLLINEFYGLDGVLNFYGIISGFGGDCGRCFHVNLIGDLVDMTEFDDARAFLSPVRINRFYNEL
jgi:hypothetical protein